MEPEEEAVIDEKMLTKGGIEPFDCEDHLYEAWLEEKREKREQGLLKLGLNSRRWSTSEQELSSHSTAS